MAPRKLETYASYIRKVRKNQAQNSKISKKAMNVLNSFISDTFDKIARQASVVIQQSRTATLTENVALTSIRLLLPPEIVREAERTVLRVQAGQDTVFPVGRLHRYLKTMASASRVSRKAAVVLAATLEYLTAELLEVSAAAAAGEGDRMLKPRHILLGINMDVDLRKLFASATIAAGGVQPMVHRALTAKPKAKPKKKIPFPPYPGWR